MNHCVLESLQSSLTLNFKCKVHHLDGNAKGCTDLFKVYDEEYFITCDMFGNDCFAVNFILI